MTGPLRIDLLGPLVVRLGDTPLEPGPLRQQALLAVLALRANRVCTAEELFDAVWGDKPPATGLKVLPTYIYRLRRALPLGELLERTRDGYVLRLPPDVLDVSRFDTAVRGGNYAEALELFHGEPLSGLPGQYLATHRQRLVELRYKALSDRIDLDLASGRHADVVPELVTAVADRPFDERLAGQLMLALYAGGRQAEALTVYTDTRDRLVEQLGVEPGSELRATHQKILRNESAEQPPRDELPYQDAAFVGRSRELAAIVTALDPADRSAPPVVAVDGMGGAGKTALAIRAARMLADVYPDGLLYLQLHGHTPGRDPLAPQAALGQLLTSIGVKPERVPRELDGQAALWRSEVAGRRVLIVLDDAPNSHLIAPLLPGAPSCGVLITSRRQLSGIDAAHRVPLDVLSPGDAAKLLAEIIGPDRATAPAAHELVERCGYLPLAIRIAAARLRHRPAWTVEHLNQRLLAHDRLDELSADGRGLRSTFALSYEQLDPQQQRLFRSLGLLPGRDFDRYGAAALAGLDTDEAEQVLEQLLDANLLLQTASDRFQFHDLLRQYATDLSRQSESEQDRRVAVERLLEYYLQTAYRAVSRLTKIRYLEIGDRPSVDGPTFASAKEGLAWGEQEGDNLLAAVQKVADGAADELSWRIAAGFARQFHERNLAYQRDTLLELGLAAAERLGDLEGQAWVLFTTAVLSKVQNGPVQSIERTRAALGVLPENGSKVLRGQLLNVLGELLRQVDPGEEAIAAHTAALELAQEIGDQEMAAHAMAERATTEGAGRQYRRALASFQLALAMARANGDQALQPHLLNGIAESHNELGRPLAAIEAATEAQRLADAAGLRYSQTDSLCQLGNAHRLLGDYDQAIELLHRALALSEELSTRFGIGESRLQLGRTYLAAGRPAESRAYFEAVVESAQERAPLAARGLDGLAACAEAAGADDEAAAHLDEALRRLGPMNPLHADELRRRRHAIARSA